MLGYKGLAIPSLTNGDGSALEILDFMRRSGMFCCIDISSDYHYCWNISVTLSELLTESVTEHEPVYRYDGSYLSRGLAECLVHGKKAYDKMTKERKKNVRKKSK
jgi:hypothetical protein